MRTRIEIAGIDCLMLRLFDDIQESNMPWLLAATERIETAFGDALIDVVPSYTSLMVHYDLFMMTADEAQRRAGEAVHGLVAATADTGRAHVLPVWYDESVGPELALLADAADIAIAEVVRLHSEHEYSVFALGFAPGFAFMGLVDPVLARPRLSTPRKRVAPGSVAIAERQTAAYPVASPGGWNVIGRTPVQLFDPSAARSLLLPGDRVRFEPVDKATFLRLGGDHAPLAAAVEQNQ